jgi:RNase P/RNase MRP subunit p30
MINTKNINEARKEIQRLVRSSEKVMVHAQDDDFNRKIFEIKDVDMVVGLELNGRDRLKQRDSGMNEVIAKLAKLNGIVIGVDVDRINGLGALEKGKVLGRLRQNVKLCRRTGAKIVVIGVDRKDASGLVVSLGGSTVQGKMAYLP